MKKNLILLLIIVSSACLPVIAQKREHYSPQRLGEERAFTVDTTSGSMLIEARGALTDNRERDGRSADNWGIAWNCVSPLNYEYVTLNPRNTDFGHLTDIRVVDVEYGHVLDGKREVLDVVTVKKGLDPYNGDNTLTLEWRQGVMRAFAGAKRLEPVFAIDSPVPSEPECRIISSGPVELVSVVVESKENRKALLTTQFDVNDVKARISSSSDKMEGEWSYLDREIDDNRARLGGRYTLYIVKDGDIYLMLYAGGAVVNADGWTPMMVKGVLHPTRFDGHFDLTWYDSLMLPMDDDTFASVDKEGIMTLDFPFYKSRIRLYKR